LRVPGAFPSEALGERFELKKLSLGLFGQKAS
jgi:hypothetical protein